MFGVLPYVYVFLWAILAVLMFIVGIKQGPLAFVMSAFFVFMTIWYALRSFGGYPMFEGELNIIFRCILGGFLALFIGVYFYSKRKNNSDKNDK